MRKEQADRVRGYRITIPKTHQQEKSGLLGSDEIRSVETTSILKKISKQNGESTPQTKPFDQ